MLTPRVSAAQDRGFIAEVCRTLVSDLRIGAFSFIVNTVAGSVLVPRVARVLLLRAAGIDVWRAQIHPEVTFTTRHVKIGNQAFINRGCLLDSIGGITLGDKVSLGYRVVICTTTHAIGLTTRRAGDDVVQGVHIGDGAWIGAGAVVLPGVTIGRGCVIAAGAIVRADCDPDGLYAGVPAKRIGGLE